MMALHRYFKPSDDLLPSSTGHLSSSVNPVTIKAANEAVREGALTPTSKSRGTYVKYTPVQQAMIGVYASMHGNLAAVCHFTKKKGVWAIALLAECEN